MKINYGLILATLISTSVMAQVTSPPSSAPAAPAPADAAPAAPPAPVPPDSTAPPAKAKKAKKRIVKKKTPAPAAAAAPAAAPLMANQSATAKQDNVNVRGQPRINSEVVGHLKKGEVVTVLEEITLKHPKTDEPAKWAKITMPPSFHAWINTSYIDAATQTVKAKKLNLRSGPGENYSVIGMLHKGDAVKSAETKGDWTAIDPPAGSYAFVAAHLLEPAEAAPVTPSVAATPAPPVPTVVDNGTPIAAPPTETPGGVAPAPVPPPIAPAQPAAEEPLPKRVVEREGIVGGTVSIQSPSHYALKSLDNGRTMDYLYTSSTNVVLGRYKGLTVLVTGEEALDERWPNTPVITIQKIQVVK